MKQSALEKWTTGIIDQEVLDFWNDLKSKSSLALSSYLPFVRISYYKLNPDDTTRIDDEKTILYSEFNFQQSQLKSEKNLGKYGLTDLNMEVAGKANSLFKINLTIKIYNPNIIKNKSDDIVKLFHLGANAKVEFGWNKGYWEETKDKSIDKSAFHRGRGHELFCKVSGVDISADNQGLIEVKLNLTAPSNTILNDVDINNIDKINWEEGIQTQEINRDNILWVIPRSNLIGVKLKNIVNYFINQLEEKPHYPNTTIPSIGTSEVINKKDLSNSTEDEIIIDGNTIGDFIIAKELIKKIRKNSKTLRKFINNLCDKINTAYEGDLELELTGTPNAKKLYIVDNAQIEKNDNETQIRTKSSTNINENVKNGKFLELEMGTGNTLVKDISFEMSMDDGMKSMQIYTDQQNLNDAIPSVLKQFITTWLIPEDEFKEMSEEEKEKEIEKLMKVGKEELLNKTLLEKSSLTSAINNKEDLRKYYSQVKSIVKNRKIRNNPVRYLPYKMSCTIFGISDIWKGSRIYLGEDFLIPFGQNTVWVVTDVNHSISPGTWETSLEAQLEWRKEMDELSKEIERKMNKINKNLGSWKSWK